jgi:hypothetical protein
MLASSGAGAMASSGAARFDGRLRAVARGRSASRSPVVDDQHACVSRAVGRRDASTSGARRAAFHLSGAARDARCRAVGGNDYLGGRRGKGKPPFKAGKDDAARDVASDAIAEPTNGSPSSGGDGAEDSDSDADADSASEKKPLTARQRLRFALRRVDSDGYWAVISSGIVFGTFLLETYNISSFGGWDVLYRDDISWYTGLISMNALEDIEDAYNLLFFLEFCIRAWAFEGRKEFWTNPVTAVDFLATIPPVLSFFEIITRTSPIFRFLRLLRVLRLLRLLDRSPNSVLFGLVRTDSMGIQLIGIGAEFVCIFVIAAGVIYDLEYTVNPNVNNLNDTLYWAILTLTGIGQPFEVVTAGGRVATVLSIAVALIVVPGQLAKLATVAGAQDIMRGMGMNDDDDEDAFSDEAVDAYVSGEWEELETAQSPSASFGMGFAGPGPLGGFVPAMQTVPRPRKRDAPSKSKNGERLAASSLAAAPSDGSGLRELSDVDVPPRALAMRPKVWDGRECGQCGLQIHEADARFCRRCGDRLGLEEAEGQLYVRRDGDGDGILRRKTTSAPAVTGSRKLPFQPAMRPAVGRLGIDISKATMDNYRNLKDEAEGKMKRRPRKGRGKGGKRS